MPRKSASSSTSSSSSSTPSNTADSTSTGSAEAVAPRLPLGFRLAGVACGLKSREGALDLALCVSDRPATGAGVYTRNQVRAAPVELDRARTPGPNFRAVVVNSGCANACTGKQGATNAQAMTELTAKACGIAPREVLVMSTGIIGHQLDMSKIAAGIIAAESSLAGEAEAVDAFSAAIMTTDTRPKRASRVIQIGGQDVVVAGFAKGAGMIGPNMATLLGLILTDAAIAPQLAAEILRETAEVSFNSVSVDGHTSTNDTLLLLANGAVSDAPPLAAGSNALRNWKEALREVAVELAMAIADDGEGATHLIAIRVHGAEDFRAARTIAQSIAGSPLVKAAIAGGDPNWGRIVSAAGYAAVPMNPRQAILRLNGTLLFSEGEPLRFDPKSVSASIRGKRLVEVDLSVGEGPGNATVWTCDLTTEYVHINADYPT